MKELKPYETPAALRVLYWQDWIPVFVKTIQNWRVSGGNAKKSEDVLVCMCLGFHFYVAGLCASLRSLCIWGSKHEGPG